MTKSLSNTQQRVISALILVAILIAVVYLGAQSFLIAVLVLGLITIDELWVNFYQNPRSDLRYVFNQISFSLIYVSVNLTNFEYLFPVLLISLVYGVSCLIFLFGNFPGNPLKSKFLSTILGILVAIAFCGFANFVHRDLWVKYLCCIFLLSFGMDTGAWFFGRKFGKHKLWKKVSPNKTVEGLIGGLFTGAILGFIFWANFVGQLTPVVLISFPLIALLSQLGDLFQSKIKRLFDIKDSSALIPGHGGVYDRIDSILFVGPFFSILLYLM